MAIAYAGKNQYLASFYEKLLSQGQRMLHLHFEYLERTHEGYLLTDEHSQMLEAIRDRNVDLADELAHAHTAVPGQLHQLHARELHDGRRARTAARCTVKIMRAKSVEVVASRRHHQAMDPALLTEPALDLRRAGEARGRAWHQRRTQTLSDS